MQMLNRDEVRKNIQAIKLKLIECKGGPPLNLSEQPPADTENYLLISFLLGLLDLAIHELDNPIETDGIANGGHPKIIDVSQLWQN